MHKTLESDFLHSWIQKDAAKLLDVKPTTLNEMIKRYGIREEFKEKAS
ncbi:MAG: hypothetical protein ACE5HV_09690 [Acidobacteriota bacterium]